MEEYFDELIPQDPQDAFYSLFKPLPQERQDPPAVLIESTLYSGAIMLIAAAPKTGKTFLAAAMAVAFALGKPFLGFKFHKCEDVLIVNSEMAAWEYSNRLIAACANNQEVKEAAEHIRIAHTDSLPEMTIESIASIIVNSGYKPDVVIVDPLYPLFCGDENSNEDAKKTLAYMKQIASVTGAGVIYLHHFSKGAQDNKEARDRASGAGTLGRNYSALWSITELAPDEDELADYPDNAIVLRISTDLRSFRKSKASKNLDFNVVRMDSKFVRDEEGVFNNTLTREAARKAKNNPQEAQRAKRVDKVRRQIEKLLAENHSDPVLFSKICSTTGISRNTLNGYILDMDEYQVVKIKINGKGQAKKHIAWANWQLPLDAEAIEIDEL